MQEYGYDLFNINDLFYQDICTQYTSINGTDVLLSDRKNDFYDNEIMRLNAKKIVNILLIFQNQNI